MLAKRTLVSVLIVPIILAATYFGIWPFTLVMLVALLPTAWEYAQLFRTGGLEPASSLVLVGTLALTVSRAWNGFESAPWLLALLVLVSMAYHLWRYEKGRDQAATDFAVTVGGVLYVGWLGAYLVSLYALPDGKWWTMIVLPCTWMADTGGYLFGKAWGRHQLVPRLSPKKTWEGYLGSMVFASFFGGVFAALARLWAGTDISVTIWRGAAMGLALGALTLLGDLGESLIKRQVGAKDSGNLLPGHGGMFDRIDSWLWAGVVGYYLLVYVFQV
jgi:phosphatidate cytidylyltransferase